MEHVLGIGGVFFKARDPQALAATTILAEGHGRRRLLAAGAIFAGIVLLAIG